MKSKILFLLICIGLFLSSYSSSQKTCIVTGKVINRPQSTKFNLTKSFEDFRSQTAVTIPIKDGTFTFEINFNDVEAYTLAFDDELRKGSWRPITFFSTNGTIEMELYPIEEHDKNIVSGGKENERFFEFEIEKMDGLSEINKSVHDSINALIKNDKYDSQIMKDLHEKLKNTEKQEDKNKLYIQMKELYQSGEGLTPVAKKLNAQNDSIWKIVHAREFEYMKSNISIHNYYLLIQSILNTEHFPKNYDFNELSDLHQKYASKFENHTYTQYSSEILWRFTNMKPGGTFYDFTLPDLNGKPYKLSDEIKGKYAFIDIWAPWCGSCIAKGRAIKPVFEEYKNKGFTVLGVASKYYKEANVKKRLRKDKYPWVTLLDKPELDSRINEHYGIEKAGGGTILVDNTGKIVLVNPTAGEVREVLEANL